MAECEYTAGCPFFNDKMANMPALAGQYKNNYCKSNFEKCARFRVLKKLGKDKVPSNLFPNQEEKANEIIGEV